MKNNTAYTAQKNAKSDVVDKKVLWRTITEIEAMGKPILFGGFAQAKA